MTSTTTHRRTPDRRERGSTMVVVMALLVALLGAGAIALYLQVAETRSASLIKLSRESLFCAEAGLAAAREQLGEQYTLWNDMLDTDDTNNPPNYPYTGDIDGDGTADYEVIVRDNDDEAPNPNDPNVDNDLTVFVVSRCTKYAQTPREVMELITYRGQGAVYRNQAGQGQGNTNNNN